MINIGKLFEKSRCSRVNLYLQSRIKIIYSFLFLFQENNYFNNVENTIIMIFLMMKICIKIDKPANGLLLKKGSLFNSGFLFKTE